MHKSFTPKAAGSAKVHMFTSAGFEGLKGDPFPGAKALAAGQGFTGAAGQMVLKAGSDGKIDHVLYGLGNGQDALGAA